MPRVQCDDEEEVVAKSVEGTESVRERVDPEVARALSASDLDLIRVVEDVVDLLIDRNLLRFTDLPAAAREKLMQRRALRKALNPLTLLGGVEGDVI